MWRFVLIANVFYTEIGVLYFPKLVLFTSLSPLSSVKPGNVGVSKSVLGEITDSTNQSMAFALFGFCWGIGGIGMN